jgi:hypothetical protein
MDTVFMHPLVLSALRTAALPVTCVFQGLRSPGAGTV